MTILDIWNTIEALRTAKDALQEAMTSAQDDETYLGAFEILADECAEFSALYEEESRKLPELECAEW